MRIIAGEYKGRKLLSPNGQSIKPTGDKVKEAIFSMTAGYIEGAVVIDLFSGSGCLGLEAISRGAGICYFCDNSKDSIALIKKNIEICGATEKSRVLVGDFKKTLLMIPEKANVIFLDPPFEKGVFAACFESIHNAGVLAGGGIVVAEHGRRELLPGAFYNLGRLKEKKYGVVHVSLYVELNN